MTKAKASRYLEPPEDSNSFQILPQKKDTHATALIAILNFRSTLEPSETKLL